MAVSDGRIGRLRVTVTVILALISAIVPLPEPVNAARPDLLLLLVIYWSLSAPRIAGLTFAWLCGLAIDLLKGMVLGQHALACEQAYFDAEVADVFGFNAFQLGLARFDMKYSAGTLPHEKLMTSIELFGTRVAPRVRELLGAA